MSNMNLHQSQSHEVLRSWQSQRADVNHHKDFVLPMFIGNDDDSIEAIDAMPGVYRYGSNRAIEYLDPLVNQFGLRALLLFPVITKGDQAKLEAQNDEDDDKDDDADDSDNGSLSGETNSSASSFAGSPSSSSNSTDDDDDDDDDDDGRAGPRSVMPERLMPEGDEPAVAAATANSQNPFLNQNEEEEDHLLVDDMNERSDRGGESGDSRPVLGGRGGIKRALRKTSLASCKAASLGKTTTTKKSAATKSRDVRLIRGLALKDENNPVLRLIPRLRAKFPELLLICDVCLCTFTSTGHCCLFDHVPMRRAPPPTQLVHPARGGTSRSILSPATPLGTTTKCSLSQHLASASPAAAFNHYPISNKQTCQYLALLALEYAIRGCNVIAPSDMMDGRIKTIREKLNENQFHHVSILSYSAKFASAFYGPFRQATMNAPEFGDRRAYQLPPGSRAMAMKAVKRDIEQGADFVMVKPGGPYLDIVRDLRETHPNVPIAVYQVSGEYSMLKIAANANILDLKLALNEMLTAYRRAGATIIISYFTPEILRGEL